MTRAGGDTSRRGFLAACAAGLAATAGCSVATRGLTGSSLEHRNPRRIRARRPILVAFDEERGVVTVTGFMLYGSSSCNRIELKGATYDRDADALTARIAPGEKGSLLRPLLGLGCTADMAGAHYRAEFRFAGDLPARVTVVEGGAASDSQRRTVVREEQHRLCTTDHPDGSAAAESAHWTCPEEYVAANVSAGTRDNE